MKAGKRFCSGGHGIQLPHGTFLHRRSRFSTVVSKEAMIPNFPTKLSLKFSFKSGSSVNIKIPES
ncbi:hypothetical protein HID58_054147, partial [Brassica napus]